MATWEQPRARRAAWRIAVPVVVAVAAGALVVALGGSASDDASAPGGQLVVDAESAPATPATPDPASSPWSPPRPGRWRRLPTAPLTSRVGHSLVWAHGRVIVWGGFDRLQRPLSDGASFDPDTGVWRRLPDTEARAVGARAVSTGETVVVVSPTETWRYRPADARWDEMAALPVPRGHAITDVLPTVVWRGRRTDARAWRVVAITEPFTRDRPAAAFVLARGAARWQRLPDLPVTLTAGHTVHTDGRGLLVTGPPGPGEPAAAELTLDAAAPRWTPAQAPPGIADMRLDTLVGVTAGAHVAIWGRGPNGTYAAVDDGTGWRRMFGGGSSAGRAATGLWTGRSLVVWDRAASAGAALDIASGEWAVLPRPPIESFQPRPVAWTGSDLVVWGGFGSSGAIYAWPQR